MRYYRNLPAIILYAFITWWATSCKKEITPLQNYDPTVGVLSLIKNDKGFTPGKFVFFQVIQNPDITDTTASFKINVFGKFTSDIDGSTVNAGDIIINNSQIITRSPGNLYQYSYDQISLPRAKGFMGNFIDVQVKGSNSVDSLRRQLYIPKPVFLRDLYARVSAISKNRSYHLTWNPDDENSFGKVLIQVDYCADLSVTQNPGNPATLQSLLYTVRDNGRFVIPQADLQRFPPSCYISIGISRATENGWATGKGPVEYIAVSSAFSSPILVQN